MKIKLYSLKSKVKEDLTVSKEFEIGVKKSLLDQAVRVFEDSTHFGLSRVKTRSEINATKKKLYKQKGTGGARHGAKSAHIFVGGGVVHGPTGLKRKLKLSEKMRKVALKMALYKRLKGGDFVAANEIAKITKTSEANKLIEMVRKEMSVKSAVTVVLSKENMKQDRYFRNIDKVEVTDFNSLNAFKVLTAKTMIFDSNVFEQKKTK